MKKTDLLELSGLINRETSDQLPMEMWPGEDAIQDYNSTAKPSIVICYAIMYNNMKPYRDYRSSG